MNLSRRRFISGLTSGFIGASVGGLRAQGLSVRPNFVLILADDLAWADLACYGNEVYETPNLNRLAASGMRFTDAYAACPVCSPTRASIMTGRYPASIGLTEWIPGKRSTPAEKVKAPPYLTKLPLGELCLPEILRGAGYATGHVGKWHLGGTGNLPEDQGFDVNVGGTHAGSPAGGYFLPNRMKLPGARKGEYLTDRLSEEGCRFIREHQDTPFFLYQSYHSVHTPIQSKREYQARYAQKAADLGRKINAAYAGMIQSLDEGVGRILDTIEKTGMRDRTVVFFMSDNGGLSSVTPNAPLREGKGHVYEGGIREPMIVRAPGLTQAGSICRIPVSSIDFLPTMIELAGAAMPAERPIDGVSLTPLLRGGELDREAIYWHYPHYSPQRGKPAGAVRAGDLKLLEFYEDGHLELYDLSKDIGETTDLSAKRPQDTARLHAMLVAWRQRVGAKMPTPNPAYGKTEAEPTQLKPGQLDAEFAIRSGCRVDRHQLGFAVLGTAKGGMALRRLATPISGAATFTWAMQSLQPDRSPHAWRNAFIVLRDQQGNEWRIGLYLGGQRKISITEKGKGTKPKQYSAPFTQDPYTPFKCQLNFDPDARKMTLDINGTKLNAPLAFPPGPITHTGYHVINTETAYSPIATKR
jgi:arylsulfatase A